MPTSLQRKYAPKRTILSVPGQFILVRSRPGTINDIKSRMLSTNAVPSTLASPRILITPTAAEDDRLGDELRVH